MAIAKNIASTFGVEVFLVFTKIKAYAPAEELLTFNMMLRLIFLPVLKNKEVR